MAQCANNPSIQPDSRSPNVFPHEWPALITGFLCKTPPVGIHAHPRFAQCCDGPVYNVTSPTVEGEVGFPVACAVFCQVDPARFARLEYADCMFGDEGDSKAVWEVECAENGVATTGGGAGTTGTATTASGGGVEVTSATGSSGVGSTATVSGATTSAKGTSATAGTTGASSSTTRTGSAGVTATTTGAAPPTSSSAGRGRRGLGRISTAKIVTAGLLVLGLTLW
ncbi:hypothetical protein B0H67DRAFT_610758 [Lasiosphaeris hirsuta]|uniref:Uncharacterized protein n=1 Tax=Lasiosphaeris hirsuta TaxID=260670 RepID=A0AA40AHZ6_9PEZI|nr:hypothetical protein B0H67DRAFT_610758 [Lasiosphaeris hirsuta]